MYNMCKMDVCTVCAICMYVDVQDRCMYSMCKMDVCGCVQCVQDGCMWMCKQDTPSDNLTGITRQCTLLFHAHSFVSTSPLSD